MNWETCPGLLPAGARINRQLGRPRSQENEASGRARCGEAPSISPRSSTPASPPGSHLLAYFETDGLSNGGTEAINLLIDSIPFGALGRAPISSTSAAASPDTFRGRVFGLGLGRQAGDPDGQPVGAD